MIKHSAYTIKTRISDKIQNYTIDSKYSKYYLKVFNKKRNLVVLSFATLTLFSSQMAYAEENTEKDLLVTLSPYRVNKINLTPFGKTSVLDTPYSVDAVPVALSKNQQLISVREVFRLIPSIQGENIRPQTRGMQAGVVQNTFIDGLNIAATTDYPTEQFEQIEVLNGPSGALYGPTSPAGTFNYVLKRPTEKNLRQINVQYLSKNTWSGHIDVGGFFDPEKKFGYRLNLLEQDGKYYIKNSQLKRQLASLAFDVHFSPDTVLETNISGYHYVDMGLPGTFALASNVNFPTAPNPKTVGYGQSYAGDNNKTFIVSGSLRHDFNANWHLKASILRERNDRASTAINNTLINNEGDYKSTAAITTYSLDTILSENVTLNGSLHTGSVAHSILLGTSGFFWDRYTPYQKGPVTLGTASINHPQIFSEPTFPSFTNRYRSVHTTQQSITFGDKIEFTPQWAIQAVASQSWISTTNYNKSGGVTGHYNASGISPIASLLYKPKQNMTAYFTYSNSLQQGDNAPTGTRNAGESLSPYRSTQWEIGYKINLNRINLRAALYQIRRPYAYIGADGYYALHGNQRNRGVEIMADGSITRYLTVYGGIALLDPEVHNTGSALTNDKKVLGLSPVVFNALLEYHLPIMPSVTLTADINYANRKPGNYSNTDYVAGYTVANLGIRYSREVRGTHMTWRLNVNNITDAHYWANITPSSQNGYNSTGSGTGTLGAPRSVRASMQVDL
ncbi:TonB-dependent receptor [Zymomonas mobilis]|nr:TonB-dependent receptor [Zymomonas mobilis]MDX5947878.1 TonB-dependent receptor [Zymomonas mobilis subsp. pomaceae]